MYSNDYEQLVNPANFRPIDHVRYVSMNGRAAAHGVRNKKTFSMEAGLSE